MFNDGEGFQLSGDPSTTLSSNFQIIMKKCNSKTKNYDGSKTVCKSEKEINDFVNDTVVDTW